VIWEDRELLAHLARLNRVMVPFAIRIMEGTASADEHHDFARRLIAAGQWVQRRAERTPGAVVDGDVLANGPLALPIPSVEPSRES
jgi:hypothetical protein